MTFAVYDNTPFNKFSYYSQDDSRTSHLIFSPSLIFFTDRYFTLIGDGLNHWTIHIYPTQIRTVGFG